MKIFLDRIIARAVELANAEPLIALFLGAALLAVFLAALLAAKPAAAPTGVGLVWTLYRNSARLLRALVIVLFLAMLVFVLRIYLGQTLENFQRNHGRVTRANYDAVQTIWGAEQQQRELNVDIYHEEEITDRIESEDSTKPAVLRKKIVRVPAVGNPFVSENHTVDLRQNPRKKGSAFYDGYETDCSFTWMLRNPADIAEKCILTFPLPAAGAVYDALAATLNGEDVLPQMEIKDGRLILTRELKPNEKMDFRIAFKSRGLTYWYFQVTEPREIRAFTLTLNLADLPPAKLNYPGGCMTPTNIAPANNGLGSTLTYRLDHALSDKGMGIALPELPQPGETTKAVLGQIDRAWLMLFAAIGLSLTIASVRHAVLWTALVAVAAALGYGIMADFSDLLWGFWTAAALTLLPLFAFITLLLWRISLPSRNLAKLLAAEVFLVGIAYPCAAGLDPDRQILYLNVTGLALLAGSSWLLAQRLQETRTEMV